MSAPLLFGYYADHNTQAPARMISVLELAEMAAKPTAIKHPNIAAFTQHNGKAKTKDVAQVAQFAMIVTDHDDDNKAAQEIEQLYDALGKPYLAFTTSSHMLDKNKTGKPVTPSQKWKVVIPLAEAVGAATFTAISQGIAQSLCTDPAQTRITQIAYVPNVIAKGNPYEFINKLGDPAQWLRLDDDCEFMAQARTGWAELQRRETVEVKAKPKPRPKMAGEKAGIVEKTIDSYSGDTGAVITARGYKWKGAKYLSPFSSSGAAGVSILEDGGKQYVYSHHSASDPLSAHNHNGHRLDLFDVLVALDHGGDFEAAIKHYAPIVDPEGQKTRQKTHMEEKAAEEAAAKFAELDIDPPPAQEPSEPDTWADPVDLFSSQPVPAFPMECLPQSIGAYSIALAKASGFDSGAYAFCGLMAAAGHINHSHAVHINDSYKQGGVLWGGLCDPSGGGKSAIMSAMAKPVKDLDSQRIQRSIKALADWNKKLQDIKGTDENPPPRPPFLQRVIGDTTTEAAGKLLADNDGLFLHMDEITEFIGRMDAYSGSGGGKDRGVYLKSYDGDSVVINRAGRGEPIYIPRFSIGILAGMQPETLGRLFNKSGGGAGSDGLFQRFNLYQVAPAKDANFSAEVGTETRRKYFALFEVLERWNERSEYGMFATKLDPDAVAAHEAYVNNIRMIAARTTSPRFSEHLSKFQAFIIRTALVLHCLECAEANKYRRNLTLETYNRAKRIMEVLYRHSEAAYLTLDNTLPVTHELVRAAAEMILSKQMKAVRMGDFTRHATGWRASDNRMKQEAIDSLTELDWLKDVTPDQSGRGRPSQGLFAVNPKVFELFSAQTERITQERAERYQAIKEVAATR